MRERLVSLTLFSLSIILSVWSGALLGREVRTETYLTGLGSAELRNSKLKETLASSDASFLDHARTAESTALAFETLAERASTVGGRARELCRSLHSLGLGVEARPYAPYFLLQWTDMRELLGTFDCGLPLTRGDPREVVKFVEEVAPADLASILATGFLYLRRGETAAAAERIRRYLDLGGLLSEGQMRYVLKFFTAVEDVERFLPARMPVLFAWSRLLRVQFPERARLLKPAFQIMFRSATDRALDLVTDGKLPRDLFGDWLLLLEHEQISSEFRQRLDRLLADNALEIGDELLGEFFSSRSRMKTVPAVAGLSTGVVDPQRDSLGWWGLDQLVTLDSAKTSIGLYLAPNEATTRVELWSDSAELPNGLLAGVRVYTSEDNFNYAPIGKIRVSSFRVGNLAVMRFDFPARIIPYLKVAVPEGPLHERFSGIPRSLIRALGPATGS